MSQIQLKDDMDASDFLPIDAAQFCMLYGRLLPQPEWTMQFR